MAKTPINNLKNWFKTGLRPSQEQFWNWMDSFWHKDEKIPQSSIEDLTTTLNQKAEKNQLDGLIQALGTKAGKQEFEDHLSNPDAHHEIFVNYQPNLNYPADDGKIYGIENGVKKEIVFVSENTNMANADLTFAANRTHDLGTKRLKFTNGEFEVPAVHLPISAANTSKDKIWYDGLKAYLTNKDGINKPFAFDEFTTQVISIGGNYNNLEITADLVIFTNTNAQAIINGVWGKSDFLMWNAAGIYEVKINHNSPSVSGNGQPIILPTASGNMGLKGTGRITKAAGYGYLVVDAWNTRYRPEFTVTKKEVVTVNENNIAETMGMTELYTFRDAQATTMSKAQLNAEYPDALRPFIVVCPLIKTAYHKINNNTGDWSVETLNIVL